VRPIDGQRFRTTTRTCEDWYDVMAVVRLMNALLDYRRAPGRPVFMSTDDQTARLFYASPAAARAAFAEGLLKPGEGTTAEALGRAFEREVIEALPPERRSAIR
jgi:hypothetical protein